MAARDQGLQPRPAGIARGASKTGTTDPATIIETITVRPTSSRRAPPLEFLAALHVESNYRKYFGELPLDPPLNIDVVRLSQRIPINSAARCVGSDPYEIAALNPSLLPAVNGGGQPIPTGYELRLPNGTASRFLGCAAGLPPPVQVAKRNHSSRSRVERASKSGGGRTKADAVVHKVKPGQTLAQIASLYGCTVDRIRRGNNLKGNKIHAGQMLRIPAS